MMALKKPLEDPIQQVFEFSLPNLLDLVTMARPPSRPSEHADSSMSSP